MIRINQLSTTKLSYCLFYIEDSRSENKINIKLIPWAIDKLELCYKVIIHILIVLSYNDINQIYIGNILVYNI
jgi:hypothetical protein